MAERAPRAYELRISRISFALSMLMLTLAASLSQASAQTTEGTVQIVPAISNVPMSEGEFTTFIVVEDLAHFGIIGDTDGGTPSIGLAAFEFTLSYDETVVEVIDAEGGPSLGITGREFQCLPPNRDEPGVFVFGCISLGATPEGRQGTFTLAQVRLRPVAAGPSTLLLEAQIAGPLGDEAALSVKGGAVTVTGAAATSPPATAAATSGPTPGRPPAVVATVPRGETPRIDGTPAPDATPGAGQTPAAGTATLATVSSSGSPTVAATQAAPSQDDEEDGDNVVGRPRDTEAQSEGSTGGSSGSSGSGLLWTITALGSLTAVAALGLGAVLWRRRRT